MQSWKTLSRRTVLDRSPYLTVEDHAVQLPDGRVIPNWPWVITPDFVNIVPVTDEDRFLCFRQVKYGAEGLTLACIGGYLEPGEAPLAAAQRELREETGYSAPDWLSLGSYTVDANRGNGKGYYFLARHARPDGERKADDLEEQHLLLLTRNEVEAALLAGEFKVMPWVSAMALALLRMRGGTKNP
jgi:ADP-ribose pyrophosphatase